MAHRDGIYQRGNAWWLHFCYQGERYRESLGRGITRKVAKELAQIRRAAILRGEAGIGKKKKDLSFDKAAELFLAYTEANNRPKTLRSYTQCVGQLKKTFSGMNLGEIHPFLIEKHKQKRLAEEAPIGLNRELTCLKTLFNRAIKWKKYEGANPASGIKGTKESPGKTRFLSPDEEAELLAVAKEPLRTIILVGIHTGLRIIAEALTLRWENVDLVQGLLTVEAAYAKNKETETILP
jgi:integrase